jgi:Tfp pilus assembly protein PilN
MKRISSALLVLVLAVACGGGKATAAKITELESRNSELEQRVNKLDADLKETQRLMVQQQQTIQALGDRLKIVEVGMDKLAYSSAR